MWRRRGSGAAPLPFFSPPTSEVDQYSRRHFVFFSPMLEVDQMSESVPSPPTPPATRRANSCLFFFFFFFFLNFWNLKVDQLSVFHSFI